MRICIFGAGASGGFCAVRLAGAGHNVSVVARGEHLQAIRKNGLSLLAGDTVETCVPRASDDPRDLGPQDLVLVATKSTALPAVAMGLEKLVQADTLVAFPQNGMGWWYRVGLPPDKPPPPELRLFALARSFTALLRPAQIIGGSFYTANAVTAPGQVRNASPGQNAIALGEIAPEGAEAASGLRTMFAEAGIAAMPVADIRATLWGKLVVNLTGSVIALATENPSSVSRTDPDLGRVYLRAVGEAMAIAAAHGYPLDAMLDPLALQSRLLAHRPSLLQDFEAGRAMELASIVQAPLAFARSAGVDTPTLDTLAAIVMRRARDRGLFSD
jgi:2-dehydropantoate 2-reductase